MEKSPSCTAQMSPHPSLITTTALLMQHTVCLQRKAELDMSGYTNESHLQKCLFKVNKNKRPICILIDCTSLGTRIHRRHNNDTDLHVFM